MFRHSPRKVPRFSFVLPSGKSVSSRTELLLHFRRRVSPGSSVSHHLRRIYGLPSLHHSPADGRSAVAPIGANIAGLEDLVEQKRMEDGRKSKDMEFEADIREKVFREMGKTELRQKSAAFEGLSEEVAGSLKLLETAVEVMNPAGWAGHWKDLAKTLPQFVPLLMREVARNEEAASSEPYFVLIGELSSFLRPLAETVFLGKAPPARIKKRFADRFSDGTLEALSEFVRGEVSSDMDRKRIVVPLRAVDVFLEMRKRGEFSELRRV